MASSTFPAATQRQGNLVISSSYTLIFPGHQVISEHSSAIPMVTIELRSTQKFTSGSQSQEESQEEERRILFSYICTAFSHQQSAERAVAAMLSHLKVLHRWATPHRRNSLISEIATSICSLIMPQSTTVRSSKLVALNLVLQLKLEMFVLYGDQGELLRPGGMQRIPPNINNEVSQDYCVICLDKLVAGEKIQGLPCSHCFHDKCISVWLSKANTCPFCRQKVRDETRDSGDHVY